MTKRLTVLILSFALVACSATTTISSPDSGVTLLINQEPSGALDSGYSKTFPTTSFGNYRFKATTPEGDSMYGILPLKFNGGYLALDILFFAPAAFFNLREVFAYYEIDTEEGVIRYKKSPEDPWTTYRPTGPEAAGAKSYFGD